MNYVMILEKTKEVFIECNIRTFPIDCNDILYHYGFKLYRYAEIMCTNEFLFNMCRKYSNDAFRFKEKILYNERATTGRIRFSLMHELGHYLLGHESEIPQSEEEANCFASNILAPRIMMHMQNYCTADKVHEHFGLSIAASNRAVIDYRKRFLHHPIPEAHLKLKAVFYPEKPKVRIKNNQRIELEKRTRFMEELHATHGENTIFKLVEEQWLYGGL